VDRYAKVLDKAKEEFSKKLWRKEGFFAFDANSPNVVMSDQLCGFWLLRLAGLEETPFDEEKARRALKTILEHNVSEVGAFNGFKFDSKEIDKSTVQSEEAWTGSSYALSSLMVLEDFQLEEALKAAKGVYKTVWERIGMAFETPEALYEVNYLLNWRYTSNNANI